MISENLDGLRVEITAGYGRDSFSYIFQGATTTESLFLKGGRTKKRLSFALETWEGKNEPDDCRRHSEASLRGWIDQCVGRIKLRHLSEDERTEIRQFKDEYNSRYR